VSADSGRLVLITGTSRGIGRSAAIEFARRGDRVIAVARSRNDLAALARDHERIVSLVADVADAESMRALGDRVLSEHAVPDVVVANAGIGLDALLTATTDEDLRRLFEVNVVGVYRTIRPFIEGMVRRGSGRVLIVSSIVGKRGLPYYSGYAASKFALHGVADALRAELCGTGVSVGVVCPSSTRTDFQRNSLRSGPGQRRMRLLRRSPESVARAIVSMASSRRRERILGFESKLMTFVDVISPGLIDWILARSLTRKHD
jgi:short-subunit dehydrogenase